MPVGCSVVSDAGSVGVPWFVATFDGRVLGGVRLLFGGIACFLMLLSPAVTPYRLFIINVPHTHIPVYVCTPHIRDVPGGV